MNRLKLILTLLIVAVLAKRSAFAQDTSRKSASTPAAVMQEPTYPGGTPAFNKFIIKNLKYPEVAKIVGLSGKVYVSFVIDRDGSVSEAKPVKCLGAGCESEAARVISMMPKWTPGLMDGRPVRVQYTVPIGFFMSSMDDTKVNTRIRDLRNSDYVFFFYIKGKTYTLDEAQAILGKSFDSSSIASVENYEDPNNTMQDKKGIYLIVMKDG